MAREQRRVVVDRVRRSDRSRFGHVVGISAAATECCRRRGGTRQSQDSKKTTARWHQSPNKQAVVGWVYLVERARLIN